MSGSPQRLLVVLGDQLDLESDLLADADPGSDVVWMAEATEESTHVWSHKARIVLFLSAMRAFRDELMKRGLTVIYHTLSTKTPTSLTELLADDLDRLNPGGVVVTEPGEWRLDDGIRRVCKKANVPFEVLEDCHFLCSKEGFRRHAEGRKQLRMEFFYREMRRNHDILMEEGKPLGGSWNYDAENRSAFGKTGPPPLPEPPAFPPSKQTREVIDLVNNQFKDHPGELEHFDWPVTRADALQALDAFIVDRLPTFGEYQDAMWTEEPFLFHSLLASSLNLKLLRPLEVIEAAERRYRENPREIPLAAVEGFVRQILGWREYVRGVYWMHMPGYLEKNALEAKESLPDFYWTGATEMACLKDAIQQTLLYGYAHHIQRLMVTGLFAMLFGSDPRKVHEWYLAVYVDAVEWVELPNTLGMSQYADGGIMASKPYAATGKYIQRMSNYCTTCPFNPSKATGEDACPFTMLYWDFLARHEKRLEQNQRMKFQLTNLKRKDTSELKAIRRQANRLRKEMTT